MAIAVLNTRAETVQRQCRLNHILRLLNASMVELCIKKYKKRTQMKLADATSPLLIADDINDALILPRRGTINKNEHWEMPVHVPSTTSRKGLMGSFGFRIETSTRV